MVNKDLKWGEDYQDKTHATILHCTNSSCERSDVANSEYFFPEYLASIMKGVQYTGEKKHKPYVMNFECPVCNDKFWGHIEEGALGLILRFREDKIE